MAPAYRKRRGQAILPAAEETSSGQAEIQNSRTPDLQAYATSAPQLVTWAEQNIPDGSDVLSFPDVSRKRLSISNMRKTLSSPIKRRTRVVVLFPNDSSVLRLVTGILMEISEEWETGEVYLQPETKTPSH